MLQKIVRRLRPRGRPSEKPGDRLISCKGVPFTLRRQAGVYPAGLQFATLGVSATCISRRLPEPRPHIFPAYSG